MSGFAFLSDTRFLKSDAGPDAPYALAGIAWDGSVTNRPGARLAPRAIRQASHMLCDGTHPLFDSTPLGLLHDLGDLALPNTSLTGMRDALAAQLPVLLQRHRHLVWLGGDHSITLPLLQAYRAHLGRPLAVLHLDAHCDTWTDHFGEPSGHGTWVYEAMQEGLVVDACFTQIGIRSAAEREAREYVSARGGLVCTARDLRGRESSAQLAELVGTIRQRLAAHGQPPVYLSLDTSGGPEATVMRVKVREAKRQKLILGVGVNTDTGLRFSMEHTEHQLPVIGWRAVTKLLYEQPKKSLGTEWTAPPDANLWRWRTSAQVAREESGSFEVDSLLLRAGRARTTESVDRSYFLQYERARNTGTNPPPDANALSANYVWTRRDFDSRLFPTSGHGLSLDVGGGVTVGDTRYPFGRLVGKWLGYIPLGRPGGQADRNVARGTRIAARAELGAVLANEAANLPTTQLFLTGGDNTVRGYAYRSIGVTLPDGQTAAGRYLVVGSLELQRPIIIDGLTSAWDFVAFVDAGGVADKPQQLTAKVGVGAGAQWNSPIGPLQIDLAWGVATQKLRLNLSMGVLF